MASDEFWHSATPNFDAITTGCAAFLRLVVQDYSPINLHLLVRQTLLASSTELTRLITSGAAAAHVPLRG